MGCRASNALREDGDPQACKPDITEQWMISINKLVKSRRLGRVPYSLQLGLDHWPSVDRRPSTTARPRHQNIPLLMEGSSSANEVNFLLPHLTFSALTAQH
jgi:hypothetical protein